MKKGALIALVIVCFLVAALLPAAVPGQPMEAALGLTPRETKIMAKGEVIATSGAEKLAITVDPGQVVFTPSNDCPAASAALDEKLYSHTNTAKMNERRCPDQSGYT